MHQEPGNEKPSYNVVKCSTIFLPNETFRLSTNTSYGQYVMH